MNDEIPLEFLEGVTANPITRVVLNRYEELVNQDLSKSEIIEILKSEFDVQIFRDPTIIEGMLEIDEKYGISSRTR